MTNLNNKKQGYFSVREAAEYLSVTPKAIYDAIYQGRLKCIKFGRLNRIPVEALSPEALGASK